MKVVVIGASGAAYAALAAQRLGVDVTAVIDRAEDVAKEMAGPLGAATWTTDLRAMTSDAKDAVVILGGDYPRATDLARAVVLAGGSVILPDPPGGDEAGWAELAATAGRRLILSRRLRFDRLFATAKQAIRAGDVGVPRTMHASWSFAAGPDRTGAVDLVSRATELADVALWLLDDAPGAVYAATCGVAGPPLIQVNLRTATGSLALLEATIATLGLPPFRDLSLHATDGAIYHRTLQDDLLWTTTGADVLSYADDALAREVAVWTSSAEAKDDDLARGGSLRNNLAVARALAESLATGKPIAIGAPGV